MNTSQQSQHVVPFQFEQQEVRVIQDENGEPWFVAKDVCAVLEISDHIQAVERLDEDERGRCKTPTPSGTQEMLAISESGLYTLIIRSNKPQAKPFRRWVTHEVLPSIRKTGAYTMEPSRPSVWEPAVEDLGAIGKDLRIGIRLQMADIAMRFAKMDPADRPLFMAAFAALCKESGKKETAAPADGGAVARFVAECCDVDPDLCVHPPTLYSAYLNWCTTVGDDRPLGRTTFYDRVRDVVPGIRYVRARAEAGVRSTTMHFAGLGLSTGGAR